MEQEKEVMEPVLNGEDPMWLAVREKVKGRDAEEVAEEGVKTAIQEGRPLQTVKKFKLLEQNLYECLKCGAVMQGDITGDAPRECYKGRGGCGRKSAFAKVTGNINPDLWRLPRWHDLPADDLSMAQVFEDALDLVKKVLIFSSEIEYKIFVLWAFSTWKVEAWDAVGFPVFIGMRDSGKSRALRVLHYLAYRASKSSGLTHAVIPRLCHYHNATLLIDEAHNKLNPRTESGGRTLDFVKDSYKRGAVYNVCDKEDQSAIRTYRNFGFKAFAGEKSFKPGLLSRSLVFWMAKGEPEVAKLSYVEEELDDIRTALLNYRLKTDDPPDLGNNFVLSGRNREIFESIIATGRHIGVDVDDVIEYAKKRKEQEEEALKGTVEYEILCEIKKAQERLNADLALTDEGEQRVYVDRVFTDAILEEIGWLTGDSGEDKKARIRLGFILSDLGLTTKRTRDGRALFFEENEDRLLALYRRFSLT